MKIHAIILSMLAAAGLISIANGANLLEQNSSFEVGRWGFDPILDAFVQNWPAAVRPQITDETAADGKYSLKVSNVSGMDSVRVIFPPVKFDAKTLVTVSFYAKSDRPQTPVTVSMYSGFKAIQSKVFYLSDTWQRYSFSGELMVDPRKEAGLDRSLDGQATLGVYYLQFQFVSAVNNPFHQVWLDAVQMEKGELTAYAPAGSLDAAIDLKSYPVKQHLVYTEGESDIAQLQLYSNGGAVDYNVKYDVRDEFTGKSLLNNAMNGKLDSSGHQTVELKLPEMLRGLYRITADVTSGGKTVQAQRVYGVIRDLRERSRQGRIYFGGSIDPIEAYRSHWMKPKDASYRLSGSKMSPDAYLELAAKTGWQWVHFYRIITPEVNAKTEQEREWTESDIVTDMCIKQGMEPMSLMTSHGATEYLPKWILSDKKGLGGTSHGKGASLIEPAKYAVFARDAAAHYKGWITWWENWNEPGVKMRDFEYMPIMKAFYEGVKSGNPDAKVLGLCGTWDVGGDLYGWVKNCLKLGAGQYMDGVAIHGYHVTDRHYAAEVQNIIKKQLGRELPVWDTESGSMCKEPYGYLNAWNSAYGLLTSTNIMANGITRHLTNELSSGVARQSWFNLATWYDWLGKSEFTELSFDGSPNGQLIANNAIIDMLVDAPFVKELQVEGNSVAYLFDSPEGPICVYWNPSLKTTCSLPLNPDSIKLLDVLARDLPVSGKKQETILPLDENVRYLIGKKGSMKEFATAVEKISVAGLSPLKISSSRLGVSNNQPELLLKINNVSSKTQTANIAVVSQPGGLKVAMDKNVTVPEFAEKMLVCPVARKTSGNGVSQLKLAVANGSSNTILSVPVNVLYVSAAKADVPFGQQDAAVWNSAAWVPLSDWAKMKALWDDKGLYFLVQGTDDAIVNYREGMGLQSWQTDGIELYFDWNVSGDFNETLYNADDVQLVMPVKGGKDTKDEVLKGPESFAGNKNFPLNAAQMVSGRTKDGYRAQIEIKWSGVEALGLQRPSVFGFGVSVRDMDGSFKERKRALWGGDNDNYKSTEKFGLIVLEKQ